MKIKYIVYPGRLCSKNDGDTHFISYSQLVALYKVDQRECIDFNTLCESEVRILKESDEEYAHLHPMYHGNYELKVKKAEEG